MQQARPETLPAVLAHAATVFSDAVAIDDGTVCWSFRELANRVAQAAAAFIGAGVTRGSRVAIWAPNSREWIVAALAAQSAGGCIVPINTRLKGAEAGYILRQSGAMFLCTVAEFLGVRYHDLLANELLPDLKHRVNLDTEEWPQFCAYATAENGDAARRAGAALMGNDLADILYTSGTTGRPKGVMSSHVQNIRVYSAWSDITGLGPGDRYLIVNPFFHAFGYKAGWLACLLRGATILPMAVFDAGDVLRRIKVDRISVLPGPPTLFQSLLAHPERASADVSSLRIAVTGAASVPVTLIEDMRQVLGFRTVITGYGLTESTGTVSMCRPGDSPERIARSCGAPLPGVTVKVVDDRGQEVPRGQEGELWIRGYNVMTGYFNDVAATAEAVDSAGWLHTGDIGIMDADDYLRITDRKKDMFIVGGFNCYPAEIENLMSAHPAILQIAIIGIPDNRLGEVAAAHVVLRRGHELTAAALIEWCRGQMANYKVPRVVHFVAALPMTASGKVQKFALRPMAARP